MATTARFVRCMISDMFAQVRRQGIMQVKNVAAEMGFPWIQTASLVRAWRTVF